MADASLPNESTQGTSAEPAVQKWLRLCYIIEQSCKVDQLMKKCKEIESILASLSDDDKRVKKQKLAKFKRRIHKKVLSKFHVDDPDVIYDWDEYFMCIACLAALRSKDRSVAVRR